VGGKGEWSFCKAKMYAMEGRKLGRDEKERNGKPSGTCCGGGNGPSQVWLFRVSIRNTKGKTERQKRKREVRAKGTQQREK